MSNALPGHCAIHARQVGLRGTHAQTILEGVDLCVPRGAVLGLVGRNGAGKSSLIRCLMGLAVPDQGDCRLFGSPAIDLPDALRERLGYVAQTPDLFDWLNGEQHLKRFSQAYAGHDAKRALRLAARLDLPLGMRASRLSLGDQQKLSVLLALAHDPDVLVLDEPVSYLDPMSRRELLRAIFERRSDEHPPRTVLISSHLLSDLERVVSHLAFMRDGRLQVVDEWDALSEHLRLLRLPADTAPEPAQGVLHRSAHNGERRLLVDTRLAGLPPGSGEALGLDELFVALNE
jgi:ABC-2 type transport system ATP-binding protein